MLHVMSFEEEKERLIQELVDAQLQTRQKYGMKPKPPVDVSKDESPKQSTPAKS
jgi:hypothetical protein